MKEPTQDELLEEVGIVTVHRESNDDWRHGSSIYEVFHRKSDDTYWEVSYRLSTDGEWHGLREDDYYITQVRPVEVTVLKYERIPAVKKEDKDI